MRKQIVGSVLLLLAFSVYGQKVSKPEITRVIQTGEGWSGNSINTVIFRKNSITSQGHFQVISYYNNDGYIVLGKRNLEDSTWEFKTTRFRGTITDAHRSISIALDGQGYLHMAWDQHGNPLRYCRGLRPYSLDLGPEIPMTGTLEEKVTYPEFYRMPGGSLLFLYRDGSSGNGNLVIKKYNPSTQIWTLVSENLIDGERSRNAYWQACVDKEGRIHVSWVWRESPDVATNHDLCYAVSDDGGITWRKSTGERYQLPITLATAEIISHVPQRQELINQTSMFAGERGNIFIATYWTGKGGIPQFQLIYRAGRKWVRNDLGFRKTVFSLSGQGTRKIPVSRPQVISWNKGRRIYAAIIFRDIERGSVVSLARAQLKTKLKWKVSDLSPEFTGDWEPTYDTDLWKQQSQLHLFVQQVHQADAEGLVKSPPSLIQVLECRFTHQP